jgi:hypothetical protein
VAFTVSANGGMLSPSGTTVLGEQLLWPPFADTVNVTAVLI